MSNLSKNLIKMRKAAKMIERHDEFRKNFKDENFKPVQSVQFSIESIETYLEYVKSLSKLRGVEVSGIRVVNAIYPTNESEEDRCDQQTVLFIPTYENDKGDDQAFDPLYFKDGKPTDLSLLLKEARQGDQSHEDNVTKGSEKKAMMLMQEEEEESSFMNFGSMGKPPL